MPKKLTTEEFIENSIRAHGKKYNYSDAVYKNAHEDVSIICSKHGTFFQKPYKHTNQGQGCPKCGKGVVEYQEFLTRANKIHNVKYKYFPLTFINMNSKTKIECLDHGVFWQTPQSHVKGNGCHKCSGKERITLKSFVKRAEKIHGKKYNYSSIKKIINNVSKIKIFCEEHGSFMQTPDAHLNQKQGCPFCRESKGERKIDIFLSQNGFEFYREKTFLNCINPETKRRLRFDFYLPKENICIEYDGKQHFTPMTKFGGAQGFEQIKKRDEIKNLFCEKEGINLVRITYKDKVENKLKKNLEI